MNGSTETNEEGERYWRFIKDLRSFGNTIRLLASWNRRSSGIQRRLVAM